MYKFADNGGDKLYLIGDIGPGGGMVFYVTDGGLHGLEAAPSGWNGSTPDPTAAWIFGTYIGTSLPGTSTAIGTGSLNTNFIRLNSSAGVYAAQLCGDYIGGNKNDWYLPSKDELNQMYINLKVPGIGGFTDDVYFSSSEWGPNHGWVVDFSIGSPSSYNKVNLASVRPVRSF